MHIIFDDDFDAFCFERYQNYLYVCEILGIDDLGDYWSWKSNNIEWLKAKYNPSEGQTLH